MLTKLKIALSYCNLTELGVFLGKKNAQGFPVRYDEWGKEVNVPALANYNWTDVQEPITRGEVKAWVRNLRSGKYTQGHYGLKVVEDEDEVVTCSYCCLGVFAETNGTLDDIGEFGKGVEGGSSVYLEGYDGDVNWFYTLPKGLQSDLATLNDSEGKTFNQIADHLEEIFKV